MAARILVVDDDELLRELLEMVLVVEGFEVDVAGNGEEALDRLQSSDFDLVVLDLMMPILDGLRFLKRVPDGKRPPIIVLSANSNATISAQAQQLGAAAVARKPLDPEEFIGLVRSALGGGSTSRS